MTSLALPALRRPPATSLRTTGTLVFLGFGLQLLQVGIIPLLPLIGADLKISTGSASWLVTGSLLAGVVFLAVLSRLADLIGKVPVIVISLALVLIGSIIGCFATSFTGLLIGRILMGAVMPMLALPEAVASDTMPRERASVAIAAIHAGTGSGIAGGLVLGGLAGAGDASWRWFFIVGAIASAAGIVASLAWLQDGSARGEGTLDVIGATLLAIGLGAVLLAVSQGPAWGWGTLRVWGLGVLGLLVLVGWWIQQRRARHPLIDLDLLVSESVRLPLAMTLIAALSIYSSLNALTRFVLSKPALAGYGYGWKPLQISWYAIPQVVGCVIAFFLIGRLVRRRAPVQALALGFTILVCAFIVYGLLASHPFFTLLGLCLDSLGLAMILAMTQILMVRSVPASRSGVVLGLAIILYTLGNAIGTAVVTVFFESFGSTPKAPALHSFHVAFVFGGAAALACLLLCFPLSRRWRAETAGWAPSPE